MERLEPNKGSEALVKPVLVVWVIVDPVIGPGHAKERDAVAKAHGFDRLGAELPFNAYLDIRRRNRRREELSIGFVVGCHHRCRRSR